VGSCGIQTSLFELVNRGGLVTLGLSHVACPERESKGTSAETAQAFWAAEVTRG